MKRCFFGPFGGIVVKKYVNKLLILISIQFERHFRLSNGLKKVPSSIFFKEGLEYELLDEEFCTILNCNLLVFLGHRIRTHLLLQGLHKYYIDLYFKDI